MHVINAPVSSVTTIKATTPGSQTHAGVISSSKRAVKLLDLSISSLFDNGLNSFSSEWRASFAAITKHGAPPEEEEREQCDFSDLARSAQSAHFELSRARAR